MENGRRESPTKYRVKIPVGIRPGDVFPVTAGGKTIRVRCPELAIPGQYLEVSMPKVLPRPTVPLPPIEFNEKQGSTCFTMQKIEQFKYQATKLIYFINDLRVPRAAICWICLETSHCETKSRPLIQGCSCHGESIRYCHVECRSAYSLHKENTLARMGKWVDAWQICPTCQKFYTGRFYAKLALESYGRYKEISIVDAVKTPSAYATSDHLAWTYLGEGRPWKALPILEHKYEMQRARWKGGVGRSSQPAINVGCTVDMMGRCLFRMGYLDDAKRVFELGLSFVDAESKAKSEIEIYSALLDGLSNVYTKQFKFSEAVEMSRRAIAVLEKNRIEESTAYCQGSFALACDLFLVHEYKEGVKYALASKRITQKLFQLAFSHIALCYALIFVATASGFVITVSLAFVLEGSALGMISSIIFLCCGKNMGSFCHCFFVTN